eukprot:m.387898 g.387898  ORF g.387898 m.387898 type:complete len:336 (-) comp20066_c18_seq4:26-1033(-)
MTDTSSLTLVALTLVAVVVAVAVNPQGQGGVWKTCGDVAPAYNATACDRAGTCCHQAWAPGPGNWGCCPHANAVCCDNGYTCCPSGHTCKDSGANWSVVTTCEPTAASVRTGNSKNVSVLGNEVCKQGAPIPLSTSQPNILIVGDSVSIGYTPFVAEIMQSEAFVQHSPWGGDGGAEEAEYGYLCLEYLLRAPNGTALLPDVIMFNWGLHNCLKPVIIPGQSGLPKDYAPYLAKIVAKLKTWGVKKLLFAITSPMLCDAHINAIDVQNNEQAVAIMKANDIPTVDLYQPIIDECGDVPTTQCFNLTGCWCPHCPPGYSWLANSTIVPALRNLLKQ